MDRTGDTVELLVEHAADFRMCDLLDESTPLNPGSGSGTGGSARKPAEDLSGLIPGNRCFCYVLIYVWFNQSDTR